MAPLRLPRSTGRRQGQSLLCTPHARACQSPGLQGSRSFVLHHTVHHRSHTPETSPPSLLSPTERGLSSSYLPVRASCLLGFCLAVMAQDTTADENSGAHRTGLYPNSLPSCQPTVSPSPIPPCLRAWPGQQVGDPFLLINVGPAELFERQCGAERMLEIKAKGKVFE